MLFNSRIGLGLGLDLAIILLVVVIATRQSCTGMATGLKIPSKSLYLPLNYIIALLRQRNDWCTCRILHPTVCKAHCTLHYCNICTSSVAAEWVHPMFKSKSVPGLQIPIASVTMLLW